MTSTEQSPAEPQVAISLVEKEQSPPESGVELLVAEEQEPSIETAAASVPLAEEDALRVMSLVGVAAELPSAYPEIVLREVAAPWRELRFRIGYPEGMAMAQAWRRLPTPRPLTHEVWARVLRELNVTVEVVRIVGVENGVYFAELVLAGGARTVTVSCRPSDAITLALRQDISVPILVAESVLVARTVS